MKNLFLLFVLFISIAVLSQNKSKTLTFENTLTKGKVYFNNKNAKLNTALYLLDGKVITATMIEKINPEIIKSIQVFKDEKAIELYGKKAKDGVVVITTIKNNTLKSK